MTKKNILFLITLCCAINIIAGPKDKKSKGGPQNFVPVVVKIEPPTPVVKIDTPPTSPLDEEIQKVDPKVLEQTRPLNSPKNSALAVPTQAQPSELSISPQANEAYLTEMPLPASSANPFNLAPAEIKKIENLQALEEKGRSNEAKKEELKAELVNLRKNGWDLGEEDDDKLIQPKPPIQAKSLLEWAAEVPQAWWKENVTDEYRVERFMRYTKMIPVYTIICQKIHSGEFSRFIDNLNQSDAEDGHRWLDEALNQSVADKREDTTVRIMNAAISYKKGLSPLTRSKVVRYLNLCADKKRNALCADHEDYASEMHALAITMREAEQDLPEIPIIPVEILEQSARDTALALTKCATGGYLPRQVK